ncbi:methanogenesis marker 9 domain-containing protein [Methanoplanus sp. FWC-SCC4]|uniref:Methanogenesis marker 9 domain-containing protein n=1 Tax=Methanochimaera problematica TaxID=2609417 RepID=A0AA97FBF3_9EURY|nr:methanogenesis marker 9 domain-containing protein [Methanoplanus sp. FWC-SCC4]WOF16310.1 methanogenesis marker 9 domain-containing protein [Methanoplanus sp. FWC-SCC4]
MMDPYDRYELMINGRTVKTPVAIASMAGIVDANYVLERKDYAGIAFLGGFSIDEPAMNASLIMEEEGRKEFILKDPVEEIKEQVLKLKDTDVIPGINLRGTNPESFVNIATAIGKDAIYEIDAHCRQPSMINAGSGEFLLKNTDHLSEIIKSLKELDVTVSVKIRAGVAEDDAELAKLIWKAGADIIHVDLMDFGHAKLRVIRNSCPLLIIANNSINNFEKMREMLTHGADIVSLARHSDSETLKNLSESIAKYADETGWYNSPKQLCRGGDLRSLTFCCKPVKQCPLLPAIKKIGMSPKEFHDLKVSIVENTPLASGESTCFGSLAWCCKSSTPCMFRDISLRKEGLSHSDYMRYKHRLSEKIMKKIFEEKDEVSC